MAIATKGKVADLQSDNATDVTTTETTTVEDVEGTESKGFDFKI